MFTPGRYPATRSSARSTAPSAAFTCADRSVVSLPVSLMAFSSFAGRLAAVLGLELRLGRGDDLFLHGAQVLVVVRAEVGVDHALVAHDGIGRALGDDLALRHHDHPVGDVAA